MKACSLGHAHPDVWPPLQPLADSILRSPPGPPAPPEDTCLGEWPKHHGTRRRRPGAEGARPLPGREGAAAFASRQSFSRGPLSSWSLSDRKVLNVNY